MENIQETIIKEEEVSGPLTLAERNFAITFNEELKNSIMTGDFSFPNTFQVCRNIDTEENIPFNSVNSKTRWFSIVINNMQERIAERLAEEFS